MENEKIKRKSGFYWVVNNNNKIVAEWSELCQCWWVTQMKMRFHDHDFTFIADHPLIFPS